MKRRKRQRGGCFGGGAGVQSRRGRSSNPARTAAVGDLLLKEMWELVHGDLQGAAWERLRVTVVRRVDEFERLLVRGERPAEEVVEHRRVAALLKAGLSALAEG